MMGKHYALIIFQVLLHDKTHIPTGEMDIIIHVHGIRVHFANSK